MLRKKLGIFYSVILLDVRIPRTSAELHYGLPLYLSVRLECEYATSQGNEDRAIFSLVHWAAADYNTG